VPTIIFLSLEKKKMKRGGKRKIRGGTGCKQFVFKKERGGATSRKRFVFSIQRWGRKKLGAGPFSLLNSFSTEKKKGAHHPKGREERMVLALLTDRRLLLERRKDGPGRRRGEMKARGLASFLFYYFV